jgi:HK97 family phage portal protein
MGVFSAVRQLLTLEPYQLRTVDPFAEAPDLAAQLAVIQAKPRPWRLPSVREALGVPAIQRAVTLIANSTGSLTMQGWQLGQVMDEAPRLIVRPDPYSTPRDCYRDMAYLMASRGEVVLWVASRDGQARVTALIVVPPAELTVEDNPRNRLFPIYTWGNVKGTRWSPPNPTGDFVHITYLKEPGTLRGVGPLQLAGAAVSVSVEAQEWAANLYADGGKPSVNLHTPLDLTQDEAAKARAQWVATPPNMPQVTSGEWELRDVPFNENNAQMLDSREHQNGEAARLFGIPGALMEYGAPGSSLTYQNLADVWINFVRGSLAINYLEPIEQAMTDLLPRTTIAKFNVKELQRADEKTRWEIYTAAVGVIGPDEAAAMARKREGLEPGDSELAPVPFAPAPAVPSELPQLRSAEIRCTGMHVKRMGGVPRVMQCNRLLSKSGSYSGPCPRCKTMYAA